MKEFLKRKDIELSWQRYGIDALGAMAQGLFCSLLIGTIIKTLGTQLNVPFLTDIGTFAMAVSGPAMAVAIGYALKAPPMVLFSLAAVGYFGVILTFALRQCSRCALATDRRYNQNSIQNQLDLIPRTSLQFFSHIISRKDNEKKWDTLYITHNFFNFALRKTKINLFDYGKTNTFGIGSGYGFALWLAQTDGWRRSQRRGYHRLFGI